MIKHWRLFDSITDTQIKQLYTAGIAVRTEDDVSEFEFPTTGRKQFVISQTVYISTVNENQESFLLLMVNSDKLQHIETEYNDRWYNG